MKESRLSLAHAQMQIEALRQDYNEHRPKKDLWCLSSAGYPVRLDTLAKPGADISIAVQSDEFHA